jgi:hypothetical protein
MYSELVPELRGIGCLAERARQAMLVHRTPEWPNGDQRGAFSAAPLFF